MKNTLIWSILLFSILLSSCISYFPPAITGNTNIGYLNRPAYSDSVHSETYISGGFLSEQPTDGHLITNLGMFQINKGNTYQHLNFGYGIFGVLGTANYHDSTAISFGNSPLQDFRKSVYGFGLRTTIGIHFISNNRNFNFRALNWENAFSVEKGAYADFRKEIYNHPYNQTNERILFVSKKTQIFTTGFSSEILWNNAFHTPGLELSYRFFLGFSPNLNESFKAINRSDYTHRPISSAIIVSTGLRYRKFIIMSEFGSEINNGAKIAIGYTL